MLVFIEFHLIVLRVFLQFVNIKPLFKSLPPECGTAQLGVICRNLKSKVNLTTEVTN